MWVVACRVRWRAAAGSGEFEAQIGGPLCRGPFRVAAFEPRGVRASWCCSLRPSLINCKSADTVSTNQPRERADANSTAKLARGTCATTTRRPTSRPRPHPRWRRRPRRSPPRVSLNKLTGKACCYCHYQSDAINMSHFPAEPPDRRPVRRWQPASFALRKMTNKRRRLW